MHSHRPWQAMANTTTPCRCFRNWPGWTTPSSPKKRLILILAQVYEKQGKKQEAADIYFNIAKAASEAKDQGWETRSDDRYGTTV